MILLLSQVTWEAFEQMIYIKINVCCTGTSINPWNCGATGGKVTPAKECTGVWALLHITKSGSCYLENVWGWVADHDLDYGDQINVYSGRGLLSESQGPVWLYGTAIEHSALYEYNFYSSQNIFMGMIQTETPYYQPSTEAPSVHDYGSVVSDPTYCDPRTDRRCEMAYGLVMRESKNVLVYGAGLYSWFDVWDQECVKGTPSCQLNMVVFEKCSATYVLALNTYGSVYMLTQNETYSNAQQNLNTFCSTAIADLNFA
jgi:glucan 1,3-beta-glucosidase